MIQAQKTRGATWGSRGSATSGQPDRREKSRAFVTVGTGNGADGWGFDDLLPFFRRTETARGRDPALRGMDGPLIVGPATPPNPVLAACLDAAEEAGYRRADDISGGLEEGFGWSDHLGLRDRPDHGGTAGPEGQGRRLGPDGSGARGRAPAAVDRCGPASSARARRRARGVACLGEQSLDSGHGACRDTYHLSAR